LECLTITSPGTVEEVKARKGAVITARVHPGETVASWMMKGVLDFLTGDTVEAKILRDNFVFKIIPMINPDGVIAGNYRTSLVGSDLNRRWKTPSKILHPTIHRTKTLVKEFAGERKLEIICDLHGHSKHKNVFMYGCNLTGSPETTRALPFILSRISPWFCYESCRFKV
jgi:murein tripeptide amidase MpaA